VYLHRAGFTEDELAVFCTNERMVAQSVYQLSRANPFAQKSLSKRRLSLA